VGMGTYVAGTGTVVMGMGTEAVGMGFVFTGTDLYCQYNNVSVQQGKCQ